MAKDDKLKAAKKKVKAKKEFYMHLIFFGACSVLFIILNMTRSPGRIWFHYPIIGWGIGGVLTHYLTAFGMSDVKLFNKNWEQKQIEKELDKMEEEKYPLPGLPKKDDEPNMELKELRKNYDERDLV